MNPLITTQTLSGSPSSQVKDKFSLGKFYKTGFQKLEEIALHSIEKNWPSQAVNMAYQRYNHMLYKDDTTLK